MNIKRALLIGVDRYDTFQDLKGCVNDVAALQPLLAAHPDGEKNFDCRTTVSDSTLPPTTDVISSQIDELFAPGADVALLYFAGHAANLDNELYLVGSNGTAAAPGVSVSRLFDLIFDSKVQEVVLILDCCFAGQAGQVTHRFREGALLRNGLSVLASSRADQTSAETNGRGFFSVLFCQALEGAGSNAGPGWVTLVDAYEHVQQQSSAWDQQPVLKVNMIAPCALRRLQTSRVDSPTPSLSSPVLDQKPRAFKYWVRGLVALAALVVTGVVVAKVRPSRTRALQTPDVLIECSGAECNQEAIARCPEGSFATNRCSLRTVRGTCSLGDIRSDNRLVRAQVRGKKGSRCMINCACSDQPPRP